MIRTTLLLFFVGFFTLFAWKNWFASLCAAVLLVAVVEHPDFPQNMGGIQGANPWNVLMLSVLLAWAARRGEEEAEWDLPPAAGGLLIMAGLDVLVGVARLLVNDYPSGFTSSYVISEYLINSFKWVMPGLLLFDACRTRRRVVIALAVILGFYFLLALQVIRWMPLGSIGGGGDLAARASKITQNEMGFNRVTLSMMLAGASWGALAAAPILRQGFHRLVLAGAAGCIAFGQALTGGRTGYVTWMALGLLLAVMRWRKLLLFVPLAALAIGFGVPGVRERMMQGLGGREGNFTTAHDTYEMTSGRDIAWPLVIDQIQRSPVIGYGRQAMVTTGISDQLLTMYDESFPHPHQAYLELLLDNGIIGFLLLIPIFFYVVALSVRPLLDRDDPLVCSTGCLAFCLVMALMIGAFGGQTFYPREGSVGMWAAVGLLLRLRVQMDMAEETGGGLFPDRLPGRWFAGSGSWRGRGDGDEGGRLMSESWQS